MGIDYRCNNKWIVYIHTTPNQKHYVGITSRKPSERWRNGTGYKKNTHFYRAIKKYGWDNIEHYIFAEHLTEDEAKQMEVKLIAELKSNEYKYGYNITAGGDNVSFGDKDNWYRKTFTKETREKMSKAHKGKKLTKEHIRKVSESHSKLWQDDEYRRNHSGEHASCYGRTAELHPMYGWHGEQVYNSKMVICIDTNELFESATFASKYKDVNHSKLCMCCRGERGSCGKDENGNELHWKFLDDYMNETGLSKDECLDKFTLVEYVKLGEHTTTPVDQVMVVNLDTNEVYSSLRCAARVLGVSRGRIQRNCEHHEQLKEKINIEYFSEYLKNNNTTEEEVRSSNLFFFY